jgi:S1-C subfamily serine protease
MAMAAALGVPTLAAPSAHADGRPPGGNVADPVIRNVDIASPAIVRIFMIYGASLRFSLCGKVATLPPTGGAYGIAFSGSGAFISANGDILTAGHVVDESQGSLEAGAFEVLAPVIADLLDANAACLHLAAPLTPDDVANGAVQSLQIPYQLTTTQPVLHVFQSTNYTGPISVGSSITRLRDIIAAVPHPQAKVLAFSEFLKDDLAVIHVDLTDTPSIAIGDSNQVAPLDKLTVLGYPGNGDLDPELGGDIPTNLFTLSINTMTVSALKQNADGAQLVQVGGNIEHGDSGGPALDATGNIVGVVSFSETDTPIGTFFFRASNSAQPLILQAGIDVKPGTFEQAWTQAFDDYAASYVGHWHKAATELEALASKYPNFAAVQPYMAYAEAAAGHESLSAASQAPDPLVLGGVAAGSVGLLLALGIVLLLLNRRRASARAAARVPAGVPVSYNYQSFPSYPGAPMPPGGAQSGPSYGPGQGQYPSGVPTPDQLQRSGPLREYDEARPGR